MKQGGTDQAAVTIVVVGGADELDEAVNALTFDDDGFIFLSRHLAIGFCHNKS